MGGSTHALRIALGRNFDKPPNWQELCPPFIVSLSIWYEDKQVVVFCRHSHAVSDLISGTLDRKIADSNYDDFSLFMTHQNDQGRSIERKLEPAEKPLIEFERLEYQGRRPFLTLRRSSHQSSALPSNSQHDTTKRSAVAGACHSPLLYCLAPNLQHNVHRYPISQGAVYDVKGRPISLAVEDRESRQALEQRMVDAQNSVVVVAARRLGREDDRDEQQDWTP